MPIRVMNNPRTVFKSWEKRVYHAGFLWEDFVFLCICRNSTFVPSPLSWPRIWQCFSFLWAVWYGLLVSESGQHLEFLLCRKSLCHGNHFHLDMEINHFLQILSVWAILWKFWFDLFLWEIEYRPRFSEQIYFQICHHGSICLLLIYS